MEIGWIMGGFMLFCIFMFFVVAAFFPETVGIQGRMAKKIEESQKEDKDSSPT